MKELRQLIEIISPNKVKAIELVYSGSEEGSNIQELYRSIAEDDSISEEELISRFYKGRNKRSYFNRLKRELKVRLINTLFLIDANDPKYSEVASAYYTCYKNAAAIKVLLARGARQVAVRLAEDTLKEGVRILQQAVAVYRAVISIDVEVLKSEVESWRQERKGLADDNGKAKALDRQIDSHEQRIALYDTRQDTIDELIARVNDIETALQTT